MKYILIISAVFPPEPVVSARLSMDLYNALKEKGYSVKVLHPEPTRPCGFKFVDPDNQIGKDEITTTSFTCPKSSLFGRIRESVSFGKHCKKYIQNHYSDIMLVYNGAWPLFGQYAVAKVCTKFHIKLITPVQDVYPESFSNKLPSFLGQIVQWLFLPMDKYILKHSNSIHVISTKMRNHLAATRNITLERFSVVMNWQDETEFLEYPKHTDAKELQGKFIFMYMGNIGPVAGVDLLIDAFELAKLKDARLVIAGSGSMKESLKEKAKNNPNIKFWDVPNGKVPEIQSKANVMMLPIKNGAASSSIPSKLPAYMFSAKPIIGSVDEDSDTAEAIQNAKCGVIVEPENAMALSEKMIQFSKMGKNELESMGENGQAYALEHFSKSHNLKILVETFEKLIRQ